MQPVAFRSLRRVVSDACNLLLAGLLALFAANLPAQGTVPSSQPVTGMQLELKRTDAQQAALLALLQAQQTPGAAEYHRWLTPAQFAARFAPEATAQQAVVSWLEQQGFQVTAIAANGMRVQFRGTAAQVQGVFGVTLQNAGAAEDPVVAFAPGSHTMLPASLPIRALHLPGFSKDASTTLATAVDANTEAAVVLAPRTNAPAADDEWKELLAEAAAQGITVLQVNQGGPDSAEASAAVLAATTGAAENRGMAASRPDWQAAPGLPSNGLRVLPDAVLSETAALAQGVNALAVKHGRVGALAPQLYRLATGHGIFTHADTAAATGSWTAADGLGAINVKALLQALATGTNGVNVALAASNTTVTHGQSLTLSYAVTGSGGTPTGTVTATLKGRSGGTVTLGPATLDSNGVATFTTTTLQGDVYDISGSYSGDATFAAGTSNTVTTTVNPENVKLTMSAPSTMLGSNIPVTVTATSASGVGAPTGAVSVAAYFSSTPTTFTGTLSASTTNSASTVISVPATATGQITLQANCTSSASFACNQPASVSAAVTAATPTVTLTGTAEAAVANSATQKYDLSVLVAAPSGSTAGVPTGSVTVQNNGTTVATVGLTKGSGVYTASLSGTGNNLVAVYGGDPNYAAANSAVLVVNAPLLSTATALTASPTSSSFGSALALTASITPAAYAVSGAPTGTVTFRSTLQGVVGTAMLGNGFVTLNTAALQAGTHTLTATYAGDTNYAASVSSAVTVTVTPSKVATTTTLAVGTAQPLAGQGTVLTATVAPSSAAIAGLIPPAVTCTGQVTLFANGRFLTNGSLSGGAVTLSAKLAAGADSLTAVYGGDTQCYGSTSVATVVSPALVPASLVLHPSVTYANAGQTIQLTATATARLEGIVGVPSGTVTFYDFRGGAQVTLGTASLAANGTVSSVATINVNGSVAGQHSFSAAYSGDSIFLPASSTASAVLFGDFSVAFNPSSLSMTRGGSATASAAVTASSGFASPIVLTCTPPGGSLISCSFPQGTVSAGGTSQLTVTTTTQSSSAAQMPRGPMLGAGAALAALLLAPFRRTRRLAGLLVLSCCVVFGTGGCGLERVDTTNNLNGGGSSGSGGGTGTPVTGTPLGTQLLTITAVTSDGSLRHTYTFPVAVQ